MKLPPAAFPRVAPAILLLACLAACRRDAPESPIAGEQVSRCQPLAQEVTEPGLYRLEDPPDPWYPESHALVSVEDPEDLRLVSIGWDAKAIYVDPADRRIVFHAEGKVWRLRSLPWAEWNGVCRPDKSSDPMGWANEVVETPPCTAVDRLVQRADGRIFYHCGPDDWIFRSLSGETWSLAGDARPGDRRAASLVAFDGTGSGLSVPADAPAPTSLRVAVLHPEYPPVTVDLPGRVLAWRARQHGFHVAATCTGGCWAELFQVGQDSEPFRVGEYPDPGLEPLVFSNRGAAIGADGDLHFFASRHEEIVSVRVPLDGWRGSVRVTASTKAPWHIRPDLRVAARYLTALEVAPGSRR